uniref:Uncharacterized protein n=1 Tax=Ditylenchus dipsaci TaxID=166011 RepID=A0A915DHJ9_9BILA
MAAAAKKIVNAAKNNCGQNAVDTRKHEITVGSEKDTVDCRKTNNCERSVNCEEDLNLVDDSPWWMGPNHHNHPHSSPLSAEDLRLIEEFLRCLKIPRPRCIAKEIFCFHCCLCGQLPITSVATALLLRSRTPNQEEKHEELEYNLY